MLPLWSEVNYLLNRTREQIETYTYRSMEILKFFDATQLYFWKMDTSVHDLVCLKNDFVQDTNYYKAVESQRDYVVGKGRYVTMQLTKWYLWYLLKEQLTSDYHTLNSKSWL